LRSVAFEHLWHTAIELAYPLELGDGMMHSKVGLLALMPVGANCGNTGIA
jgi:hypothetical protein